MKTFEVGDPSPTRPPFNSPALTEWSAEADPASAGGAVDSGHPFKLTDATAAGVEKVNVQFGMVGSFTPTGMDPIDGLTINVTEAGYVVLSATCNSSGVLLSAAISIIEPIPSDTETVGRIPLGYVAPGVDSVECAQSVFTSLQYLRCGYSHLFGRV